MDCITNQFLDWDHTSGTANAKPLLKTTYPYPCRETRCVICYEEWADNDELLVHTGTCSMICHKECQVTWLQNDCRCPWCKQCVRCGDLTHMHPVDPNDRQRASIAAQAHSFFDRFDAVRRAAADHGHLKFVANVLSFLIIRIKKGDRLDHIIFGPAPKKIQLEMMAFMEATSVLVRTARKWPSRSVLAQVLFHLESSRYMIRKILAIYRAVMGKLARELEFYPPEVLEEVVSEHLQSIKVPGDELFMQISKDIKFEYGDEEWDNIDITQPPAGAGSTASPQQDPQHILILVDHDLAVLETR